MAKESLILLFLKREIPFYYFKFLYRKEVKNYRDYLSTGETRRIKHSKNFQKESFKALGKNKLFFSLYCQQYGITTPTLAGYNFMNSFYLADKVYFVSNQRELKAYFEHLFSLTDWESVFLKPMEGEGGNGCFKISRNTLTNLNETVYRSLMEECYIFQAVVEQHPKINQMHFGCINTLRLETFKDKSGEIHLLGAFLRVGTGSGIVDNVSAGGFFVGVNLDNGSLKAKGHRFMEYGGAELLAHPESGCEFKNFELPFFKKTLELITESARLLPDRYLGWDIALSVTGPQVIEVNANPGIFVTDIALEGYLKQPIYREILLEA